MFTAYASGLIGGADAYSIYDSGTVSATVNACTATTTYAQSGNNTAALVASALAAALNSSCSGIISAGATGTSVTITALASGLSGNSYTVSATSASSNPSVFNPPSFTTGITGFSGGGGTPLSAPLTTLYTYDALDNLTCAVQKGGDTTAFTSCAAAPATWRPRSFSYDSLSRLTSATNPESGTIAYTYDLNGNLATRNTPSPNQTGTQKTQHSYTYDVLNRLITHTDITPSNASEKYAYDGGTLTACTQNPPSVSSPQNLIGRRSAVCGGSSGSSFSYDQMGRVVIEARTNYSPSPLTRKQYNVNYAYNKDGSLWKLTYPSGDIVTYTVGGAGRATQATDSTNNFVTGATYAPRVC